MENVSTLNLALSDQVRSLGTLTPFNFVNTSSLKSAVASEKAKTDSFSVQRHGVPAAGVVTPKGMGPGIGILAIAVITTLLLIPMFGGKK